MTDQMSRKEIQAQKKKEALERAMQEQKKISEALRKFIPARAAYLMLLSEIAGLYDEMDKLAKKAPNEPITNLQLKIVNSFIRKSKILLKSDNVIGEVEIFVAAGDNPEYRDVVTVLRQIRQGLERYKSNNIYLFSDRFKESCNSYELDLENVSLEEFFLEMGNNKDGITE